MFFIAYTIKGQVHVSAGRVKIVSHSSCRTSAILKYFCPLMRNEQANVIIVVLTQEKNPGIEILILLNTHVILPRLSCEGCTLLVFELSHLVIKLHHCYVYVTLYNY